GSTFSLRLRGDAQRSPSDGNSAHGSMREDAAATALARAVAQQYGGLYLLSGACAPVPCEVRRKHLAGQRSRGGADVAIFIALISLAGRRCTGGLTAT